MGDEEMIHKTHVKWFEKLKTKIAQEIPKTDCQALFNRMCGIANRLTDAEFESVKAQFQMYVVARVREVIIATYEKPAHACEKQCYCEVESVVSACAQVTNKVFALLHTQNVCDETWADAEKLSFCVAWGAQFAATKTQSLICSSCADVMWDASRCATAVAHIAKNDEFSPSIAAACLACCLTYFEEEQAAQWFKLAKLLAHKMETVKQAKEVA